MCDVVCALGAATVSGRTILAKNSDRPPDEAQALEWFEPRAELATATTHLVIGPPADGATLGFIASRPTWAWGVEHGVNVAGVAAGNETIFTTADPRPAADGLIGIDLVRLCLERSTTAAAGVEVITSLLEEHGQGGSGHGDGHRPYWSSFLIADPARAFVVETSDRQWAVEEVSTARAISNRTTIPEFDVAHRHPRQPVETLVDPRLDASRRLLDAGPLTVEAAEAHLRSHAGGDGGWTVCMHVEGVEATTASMVAELPVAGSGDHPVGRFLLGSPCRSVFVPLVVGDPFDAAPAWERFRSLDAPADARRRLERELEAQLAARPAHESGWNATAWATVDRFLTEHGT